MSRKASIAVVAGHELPPANSGLAGSTWTTIAARDHSRNDYVAAFPLRGTLARCHDATRDFVSESEWQWGARGHPVVSEADIGMANAAAGNLYHHFVSPRPRKREFVSLQPLSGSHQTVAIAA